MSDYTKEEILEKCNAFLKGERKIEELYKEGFINYKGKSKDSNEYYTEIVSKWLLEHLEILDKIPQITRKKSYYGEHNIERRKENSNHEEELIASNVLYGKEFDKIGKIIDFQTPLRKVQKDKFRSIDLLSVNDETKTIYVLEFKKEGTPETMLRCVLEAYTYLKTVNQEKLKNDFQDCLKSPSNEYVMKASPLVYVGSTPYEEYKDENRTYLHKLMEKLDSHPFFVDTTDKNSIKIIEVE